jgi:hypothetical protein
VAPISPDDALKIAQAGQEMLRKDFYSAAFIVMGAAIVGLVAWIIWLQMQLVSGREKLLERMGVHMDRSTEATTLMLTEIQTRARRRRATDVPILGMEPISQAKKLPEGNS